MEAMYAAIEHASEASMKRVGYSLAIGLASTIASCDPDQGRLTEPVTAIPTMQIVPAGSDGAWMELTPVGGPSGPIVGRQPAGVGYDGANNRLVVFFASNQAIGNPPPEVWVLTNANGLGGTPTWIQLFPVGGPPTTNGNMSATYDAAANRLTVYGGCYANCSPALADVWVLSNANGLGGTPAWSQSIVTNPQARAGPMAVYDQANNVLIAFGGGLAFYGTDQNDTRILSNANGLASPSTWSTLAPLGTLPDRRVTGSAAYDVANNRLIVYGGSQLVSCCPNNIVDYNDTWVLSDANGLGGTPAWTQLVPSGTAPPPTNNHSMVYDAGNNRILVLGGSTWSNATQSSAIQGDLWELSDANGLSGTPVWRQLSPGGTPPGPNYSHAAVYDAVHNRMIVFGGADGSFQVHTRVWVLVFVQTVSIDIKPGSDPNSINPRSRGTIPVAILSTADFDAPTEVERASLTFGRTGDEQSLAFCNSSPEDVNLDGMLDLVCHFTTQLTGFQSGDTEGILRGETVGGMPIEGRDAARVVS
jgi:hypothetical protein